MKYNNNDNNRVVKERRESEWVKKVSQTSKYKVIIVTISIYF